LDEYYSFEITNTESTYLQDIVVQGIILIILFLIPGKADYKLFVSKPEVIISSHNGTASKLA